MLNYQRVCPFCVAGVALDIFRSGTSDTFSCGKRGTFCTLLRCLGTVGKMRDAFGGHFSWQAQCLVNLDDALKGMKSAFCEIVVGFDLGHDDDDAFFVAGAVITSWTLTKKWLRPR